MKDLDGEAADQCRRKAMKAVVADELVEVDAEQLIDDAKMTTEGEVIRQLEHVVLVVRILQGEKISFHASTRMRRYSPI